MIRRQDEAFVLDTHALGESDLIVTLFTREQGKVRAVARSARRSRRRFGGLLEPLTRVRASWSEHPGRDLQRLDRMEAVRSFADMQSEPVCQAACAVLAELTSGFAHEGQGDAEQFRLLEAVLAALESGGGPGRLLRYFEYWTLRVHGLLPDLDRCAACGSALARGKPRRVAGRGALCRDCPRQPGEREARLAAADLELLDLVHRLPPSAIPADAPGPGPALELLLRGALEGFAERRFRSYRHFKAVDGPPADGGRR